jgi:hypothetical protein
MFEKLFDNLRQVVKPTSKRPAIIKIIQFIINVFVQNYGTFTGQHFTNVKKMNLFAGSSNTAQGNLGYAKVRGNVF